MSPYSEIESALRARRKELTERMERLSAHFRRVDEPKDADLEEQAVQQQNDEVVANLQRTVAEELRAVDEALERLERGTYGRCEICGEPISPSRLQALPTTRVCAVCAADELRVVH